MTRLRVIFMGTPDFAVPALRALIGSGHHVVAAYSQPPRPAGRGMKLQPSPVQQLAEAHHIPVFTPTTLKTPEAQAEFAAHKTDIAVVAAYGLLLPQAILDAPTHGCINIHPSDLPRWRGAAPLQRTLMAGDTKTACCIIRLELGLDTGPILLRESYTIPQEMNAGGLHDYMAQCGADQVLTVLDQIAAGTNQPKIQASEGVTYAEKIGKNDRIIDWSRPAPAILAQIRGLSPVPGAITGLNGEQIKIFSAELATGKAQAIPGTVLDERLLVATGNGEAIRIVTLQRPGKAKQAANQLLQGFPVAAGTYLESMD